MRALRGLLVGLLASGTLLVLAPDADAARSGSRSSKACKTMTALQKDLDSVDPSDADAFDSEAFDDIGHAFRRAAKKAPAQVKGALRTLGRFYDDLSDAESSVEALQQYGKQGERFSAALTRFSTFYAEACSSTAN